MKRSDGTIDYSSMSSRTWLLLCWQLNCTVVGWPYLGPTNYLLTS
jgi:hypothetical protein